MDLYRLQIRLQLVNADLDLSHESPNVPSVPLDMAGTVPRGSLDLIQQALHVVIQTIHVGYIRSQMTNVPTVMGNFMEVSRSSEKLVGVTDQMGSLRRVAIVEVVFSE